MTQLIVHHLWIFPAAFAVSYVLTAIWTVLRNTIHHKGQDPDSRRD